MVPISAKKLSRKQYAKKAATLFLISIIADCILYRDFIGIIFSLPTYLVIYLTIMEKVKRKKEKTLNIILIIISTLLLIFSLQNIPVFILFAILDIAILFSIQITSIFITLKKKINYKHLTNFGYIAVLLQMVNYLKFVQIYVSDFNLYWLMYLLQSLTYYGGLASFLMYLQQYSKKLVKVRNKSKNIDEQNEYSKQIKKP